MFSTIFFLMKEESQPTCRPSSPPPQPVGFADETRLINSAVTFASVTRMKTAVPARVHENMRD